jgi:predicted dehydrogenase
MIDTSSHSVDLFRFLVGEIAEQQGVMHRHFASTDVEDAAILTVKGENGCLGSMISTFVAGTGMAHIDISGQAGRLLYDYMNPTELKLQRKDVPDWEILPVTPSGGFSEEIAAFADAIVGGTKAPIDAYDGRRCLEIIQSTYKY